MKPVFLFLLSLLSLAGNLKAATVCGQSTTSCIIDKTAFEQFLEPVDFSAAVGTDAITLVSVTATNRTTGANATSLVVAGSPVPAVVPMTTIVVFMMTGGVKGQVYIISVKVSNNVTGEDLEAIITLVIQ